MRIGLEDSRVMGPSLDLHMRPEVGACVFQGHLDGDWPEWSCLAKETLAFM